ncbi:ATP-binding cassette domain-containing protein [Treponema sp. OMZ 799]|uniref:ATP-binding cassette domain-containing protein n=1 Tax=Treponema sp. OMZ 799 TaxID=2563668 RepID=UPI0020A586F4|nr:ATP-binding cassette domain-containing protein [Treponema sp. OMZ 799]UTC76826.1 ATP-binding cassette domain-containing protein [Treponema sp. OMZ 799]
MKTVYTLYKKFYKDLSLLIIFLLALNAANSIFLVLGKTTLTKVLTGFPFASLLAMSISVIVYVIVQSLYDLILNKYITYRALPSMMKTAFYHSLVNSNRKAEEEGFYTMSYTQDINVLIPFCFEFAAACFNIIILNIFLFSISLLLPLILFAIIISANIFITYLDKQINGAYGLLDDESISYGGIIKTVFQSIFLTLNNSIKWNCKKSILQKEEELLKIENKIHRLEAVKNIFFEGQNYFIPIVISVFCIFALPGMNLADLLYIIFIISLANQNMSTIFLAVRQIKRSVPIAKKYFNYIGECEKKDKKNIHEEGALINAKNISLVKNDKPIFNNIDFNLNEGDKIAVVGQNGSGKTSLLRILTMNEDAFSGSLTYNLKTLRTNTIPCLWSHPHIFNISLRDNLVFGKAVPDSDIIKILNALKLTNFVDSLPEGLDTVMDMNNLTVSDGERSRIALARILLLTADCPVLLLDEFSRNVNTEIEDLMFNLIFTKKQAIAAVTNNIATAKRFQKILFVSRQDGTIREISKEDIEEKIKNI